MGKQTEDHRGVTLAKDRSFYYSVAGRCWTSPAQVAMAEDIANKHRERLGPGTFKAVLDHLSCEPFPGQLERAEELFASLSGGHGPWPHLYCYGADGEGPPRDHHIIQSIHGPYCGACGKSR